MPEITVINPKLFGKKARQRVCAYCRVSTNSADQLNSYARQIKVYTEMISRKDEWELVGIFADEGVTGTSTDKRTEFLRMMGMCEAHKIDRIITKSVSRFARNVKEALEYVRKLKILGIGVQFEKEGIYTLSMGDEMLLNTFAAIAEEESVGTSVRLRYANRKRMAAGDFLDGNAPYGFRMTDRVLVEFTPEADIVRRIFGEYLAGRSTREIERSLNADGIPSPEGKTWSAGAIRFILKNEKYKGDFLCQKTYHTEVFPFRQKRNRGEEDQYYIEGSHKGLVRKEIFDRANEIMSARREKYRSHGDKGDEKKEFVFSGRIFCAECGSAFVRKASRGGVYRVCSRHLEAREECPSHYISEKRIENAFMIMLNKLTYRETEIISFVISLLEEATFAGKKDNSEALDASRQMADLSSKLLMFEQLHSKGYITPDVYVSRKNDLESKIFLLQGERFRMLDGMLTRRFDELRKLQSILSEIKDPGLDFNGEAFKNIVSAVMIDRNDRAEFTLTGGLRFIEQL